MHSASDITSGTLPISRGGTNATSASSALSNLGGFSASGGTISGAVNITGKLDVQNNAMHIGSSSSGAKLNFGDGDYVYLYESTDDHLYIKADKGLHLQCGSSSSYDITVQHGTDAAISLLSGGAQWVYGTMTIPGQYGSDYSVNLGFQPKFVILSNDNPQAMFISGAKDQNRSMWIDNKNAGTNPVNAYLGNKIITTTGFKVDSEMVPTGSSSRIYCYAAMK